MAHGNWLPEDRNQSSTFKELKAIYLVMQSFHKFLSAKKVKVFTDNQSTARIVCAGSTKPHLQAIAV